MAQLLESCDEQVLRYNRSNIDLEESSESIANLFGRADVIVNAVGYTQVDKAEQDQYEANTVNAIYAGRLAEVAALLRAKYFYISTDYVFDGETNSAYSITAGTNPQNVYGQSKELGEQLVANSGANYTIFRTSWLYGANGKNFAKSIASKLMDEGAASVVNDQVGTPTWTRDLAEVVYTHGSNNFDEKIVHAVASGYGSWFDFAHEIASALPDGEGYFLSPVTSDEVTTAANRPPFSALDNSETKGLIIGDWRERWKVAAPEVLAEFLTK
jgi:dTDP-4-dehydrorhamnose reductase